MADNLNILLQAKLDVNTTAKEINVQLDQLEDKLHKLGIDIDLDGMYKTLNDSVNKAKKSIEEVNKAFGNVDIGDKFALPFDKLVSVLKNVKNEVKDISNIRIFTDKDGITNATLSFEKLGKSVQSTMKFIDGEWSLDDKLKFGDNTKKALQFANSVEDINVQLANLIKDIDIKSDTTLFNLTDKLDKQSLLSLKSGINTIKTELSALSQVKIIDEESFREVRNKMKEISFEYNNIIKNAQLDKQINDYINQQKKEQGKNVKYIEDSYRKITLLEEKISNLHTTKGLDTSLYTDNIEKLKLALSTFGQGTTPIEEQKAAIESMLINTKDILASETAKLNIIKQQNDLYSKIDSSQTKLKDIETVYSGVSTSKIQATSGALEELRNNIENGNISVDEAKVKYNELSNSINRLETDAKKSSSATSALAGRLMRTFQFTMFYRGISLVQNQLKQMKDIIFELDDALVELTKVSDLTGSKLEDFTKKAYALGEELNKTGINVIQAATEFSRAGFDDSDLLNLAKASLILTSIGDGITSTTESASTLIAVMKGFKKDVSDTTNILDIINNVSNNSAVAFQDITLALQRMAGVMQASNVSMEKSVALFTAINEVLRNSEMSSTALNTLSMRLRGLAEDGEAIDGLVPKLARMYKEIAGIDLTDSFGQIKNIYEITSELAPIWNTLSENQRQYIAQQSAGVRQAKSFLTLMDNYDRVLEVTELAYNSAGSAAQEFERWQESLEGRMNSLKSAFEEFANETLSSKFMKSIIDTGTQLTKLGTEMGGLIPIVVTLGVAFGVLKLLSNADILKGLVNQFTILNSIVRTTEQGMLTLAFSTKAFIAVGIIVALGAIAYAYNQYAKQAEKAKEATRAFGEELKELQNQSKNLNQLSQRYFELKNIDKTNEQLEEYYNIQNQIKEILPTVNGYYDEYGNFIISQDENLRSLNETYEKYIKNKREDLALSAEKSNKYILKDYNAQKARIELLKQYEELVKKQTAGTLNTSDIEQLTYLQNILGIPLTESAIKKAFKEANSIINNSLDELQNNIRNTLLASDEWESIVSSELKNSLLKALPEMSVEVLLEYSEALSGGTFDVKEFINALKDLAKQSEKTKEAIKIQKTEHEKLQEAYKKGNITLAEYTEELHKLDSVTDTYKKEVSNLGIALEYLNGILDKVTKNQSLTKDEVEKLISLYPDLKNAIYETVDGWTVEENVLSLLITTIDDLKTSYINAQTAITIAMSNQVVTRLKITETELKSIQSTIDAYNLIGSKLGGLDTGSARGEKFLEKSYLSGTKSNLYSAIIDIGKLQDEIKSMQGSVLKDLNLASLGADKSSSKTTTDEIIENFKKQYKELQYLRDKDLISAQEYYDRLNALVNDTFTKNGIIIDKYLDEFRQYDVELYNLLTNIIEANAAASVEALEKELKKLTDGKIIIELQQQLVGKNTDEYLKFEKEKYTNILEQENALQKAIGELQKQGTKVALEEADKLITSYYELVRERYNIIANLQSIQVSIYKEQISALENQKKALSDLHKYTMDMIKAEYDAKKKSLQEELKGIEDIFNAKKKALRDEKDLYDYTKGLKEKTSLVADLENQLAIIKNDETAIKKRKELEEKLSKAKEELTEYQYKHSLETQEKLLDEELENQKDKFQKEIDELDDVLSNEVKLRELADKRIAKSGEKLYNQLISYSKQYGKITEDEIKDAWDNANISLQGFKSTQEEVLETLEKITIELNKIEKLDTGTYASTSGYDTSSYNDKIQQMKLNSAKWTASGDDERRRLAEENQKLGKSLGLTYDSSIGAWFWDKEKKYRVYHGGGIVGGSGYATKSTEELAKLAKGELVINKPQADKIMENVTNNSNEKIEINMPIVIEGNADKSTVDLLKEQANRIAEMVAKEFNKSKTNTGWKKPVRV